MPRRAIALMLYLMMLSSIHMTVAQGLAAQTLPNFQDGQILEAEQLNALVSLLTTLSASQESLIAELVAAQNTIRQLQTLQAALEQTKADLTALQNNVAAMLSNAAFALGPFISVEPNSVEGVLGTNIIITGANVHIRSGSGATDDNGSLTGLGNLIIGYNEPPEQHVLGPSDRGGSHNLIVGTGHVFDQAGGFVAGTENALIGPFTAISGGIGNRAIGRSASISGGINNTATESASSVSGVVRLVKS